MENLPQPLPSHALSPEQRELERQTFAIAFESALEKIAEGTALSVFCQDYHIPISPTRFRTWILRDPKRKQAYYGAQAVGAESIEDDIIRIADGLNADGTPSINDVTRSTLQINARKWILQIRNRKRYGDVKHIEQTTRIEDTSSMSTEELRNRLFESLGITGMNKDIFEEAREIAQSEGE